MEQKNERMKPGRKPVIDLKIPVTLYIKTSVLIGLGNGFLPTGKDEAKAVSIKAIHDHYESVTNDREAKIQKNSQ